MATLENYLTNFSYWERKLQNKKLVAVLIPPAPLLQNIMVVDFGFSDTEL